ncbi:hypothetical protein [Sphingobium nicotianae]|uniref:Uncharacterized protein n=1 Tax=Sphingobium nicotianae TaxID=2782607 RepID=A0A9X1ITL6_9SPHN|nr:hypothetical protein [Sphingobium nicotianae]MBT2189432.1 hypothetical protein [Sphingobium nicotianae]
MALWDIGFRHIIDVDGQLLAIDTDLIDSAALLAKANRSADQPLWLVRAGERFLLQARQMIRLTKDEVLFFETNASSQMGMIERLAA